MPMTFKDLKKGDKLNYIKRETGVLDSFRGIKSHWYAIEWGTLVIEKASHVNYWINGEPHRKEMNGKDFRESFYLPDDPLVANHTPLSEEEFDRIDFLFNKIIRVDKKILDMLLKIPDIEVAGKLAIDILDAKQRVYDTFAAIELKNT